MTSIQQDRRKITLTLEIDTAEASDLITALGLLRRCRTGEQADRCARLSNYLWAASFHCLGVGKAA